MLPATTLASRPLPPAPAPAPSQPQQQQQQQQPSQSPPQAQAPPPSPPQSKPQSQAQTPPPQFPTHINDNANSSNGSTAQATPRKPQFILTAPPPPQVQVAAPPVQAPAPVAALPPRSSSAQRFAHKRRVDPGSALSSEGASRARRPSHAHTPSGGTIPAAHTPALNLNPQQTQTQSQSQPPTHPHPPVTGATPPGAGARRQGRPIFEWFKGKIGARRSSDADHHAREALAAGAVSGKRAVGNAPVVGVQTLGYRQPTGRDRDARPPPPTRSQLKPPDAVSATRRDSTDSAPFYRTESMSLRSYSMSFTNVPSERRRELNNPYPSLPIPLVRRSYPASTIDSGSRPASLSMLSRSRTSSLVSLSSLAAHRRFQISIADDDERDSMRESLRYSGTYADEDASVRPIPPSPTRSMSITSRFGSEALFRLDSIPRRIPGSSPPAPLERRDTFEPRDASLDRRDTFSSGGGGASITSDDALHGWSRQNSLASTKPTTVMSFDSSGPPVAHIAVASPSVSSSSPPIAPGHPISSPRAGGSGSGGNASLAQVPSPVSPTFLPPAGFPPDDMRVPRHTRYHPRNNPHPASPPGPDASTVTLASSTFALGGADRVPRPTSLRSPTAAWHGSPAPNPTAATSPTVAFADAPGSVYDGLSALSLNARSRGYGRCDDDASMRAIRRRGSWESAESRWSWRPGTETAGMFSSLGRPTSLSHPDPTEESAATNRGSSYTRESFRTAYSTWTQPVDTDAEVPTVSSESALVAHRPVSVRV